MQHNDIQKKKVDASISGVTAIRLAQLACQKRNNQREVDLERHFKRFSEDMRLVSS
jgi:hypothetical protein